MKCAYCGTDGATVTVKNRRFCTLRHWNLYMKGGPKMSMAAEKRRKGRPKGKRFCGCGCLTPEVEGQGVRQSRRWFVDQQHCQEFNRLDYRRKVELGIRGKKKVRKVEPPPVICNPEPQTMWDFYRLFIKHRDEQAEGELKRSVW